MKKLKTNFKVCSGLNAILLIVLLIPFLAFAKSGGTSAGGGGGGVIYINDKLKLIDFYNTPNTSKYLNLKYSSMSPTILKEESYDQSFINKKESNSSIQVAKEILNQWSSIPYDVAGFYIEQALKSPILKWSFVDSNITEDKNHFRPFYINPKSKILTAAYYYKESLGSYTVQISRTLWNQLLAYDQTGLIIHETLRHIQIGNNFKFNDESLQKATTLIMTCQPRIKLSQYLYFILNNLNEFAEENIGSFENIIAECEYEKH